MRNTRIRIPQWFFLVLCLWWSLAWAMAQGLPAELQAAWKKTGLPEDSLSLVVAELDGPTLININGDTPRNPASVMKLVTTWAALLGLGPEYRSEEHTSELQSRGHLV